MFTELYREENREEGDRHGQQDKAGLGGGSKGERQIQPVISSLLLIPIKYKSYLFLVHLRIQVLKPYY